MTRSERRRPACEERVDVIPCQQRTVEAALKCRFVFRFREHRWHTRYYPRRRRTYVYRVFRVLKVVDIRCVVLRSLALSCDKLCKFSRQRYVRRLRNVQERNLVEHIREPLAFLFPVQVKSPNSVVQRFTAHRYL